MNIYCQAVDKPKFYAARHVTSRNDTTRSSCRAHAFCLCRACRMARLDTTSSTGSTCSSRRSWHVERVVPCRDLTWRAKWNLGYIDCEFILQYAACQIVCILLFRKRCWRLVWLWQIKCFDL